MKKIFIIMLVLLLLPVAAHAYLDYYRNFLFFSYGLRPLTIEKQKSGCDSCDNFIIRGPGAEDIKIDNKDGRVPFIYRGKDYKAGMAYRLNKDEVSLGFKQVHWFDYEFWMVRGTIQNRPFVLAGMTMEGDFWGNMLFFHIVLVAAFILFGIFLVKYWRKKKGGNIA